MRVAQVTNASAEAHPEGLLPRPAGDTRSLSDYYYSDVLVRGEKVSPERVNGGRRARSCDWFVHDWANVVHELEKDTTRMLEFVRSVPCTCRWLVSLRVFLGQGTLARLTRAFNGRLRLTAPTAPIFHELRHTSPAYRALSGLSRLGRGGTEGVGAVTDRLQYLVAANGSRTRTALGCLGV